MKSVRLIILLAAAVAACGTAGNQNSAPSIAITSPADNATVSATADVPIAFTISNFTLRAPGACGGVTPCGHIHVLVDGAICNKSGAPYNNAAVASPASALLQNCAKPAGAHTIALELHNDDHTPAKDANGAPVVAKVAVTAN